MNQQQRNNRSKKLRIANAKHGSNTQRLSVKPNGDFSGTIDYDKIEAQAADKTNKTLRQGNYYHQHINEVTRLDADGKPNIKTYTSYKPLGSTKIKSKGLLGPLVDGLLNFLKPAA